MFRAASVGVVLALAASSAVGAADLIITEPTADLAAATYDWSGPYIGVQVGAMRVDVDPVEPNVLPSSAGLLVGGHVGWNYQSDSFVIGGEADAEYSSASASGDCELAPWECSTWLNWQGSLRARAGFAAENALFYLTAGLAVANFGASTDNGVLDPFEDSQTRLGWTAGAGIELGLSEDMTARVEYRYSDYGSRDLDLDITYSDVGVTTHALRVGLSWAM